MGHLFLVRHSITTASEMERNLGQRDDPPLAPEGVALAHRLGATLAAEVAELGVAAVRIASSPALRCRQTAGPIGAALGLEETVIELVPALIEIDYGAWEGLTGEECRRRDPKLRAAWEADPYRTACPGGESGADVAARAFPIFDALDAWAAAGHARCGVVVTHNHVNRLRLTAIFGWPASDYRRRVTTDPGSYSLLSLGRGRTTVRRVNAAPLPASGAGGDGADRPL